MISRRLANFGTTIFSEISARAAAVGAVNLGQGFPDFEGPGWLKEALASAARDRHNQYAPSIGLLELREAIADRWNADTQQHLDPDEHITVTNGATEALAAACLGLFDTGDRVVVFEPFYDAYVAALTMAGVEPVFVTLTPDSDGNFVFNDEALRDAADTRGVRAILINTPHNPTGKVFTRGELARIAEVCIERDLFAITDEVYERLVFDNHEHHRLATFPNMHDRTLTLSSIGKSMSVTGWKVGWAIGPANLTAGVRAAHQFLTFSVNTPAQHATALALRHGEDDWIELAARLSTTRDALAAALRELGFRFSTPASGYFILADHTRFSQPLGIEDDVALCEHMIERAGVAAIPPSAFYHRRSLGAPLVRFAFCKRDDTIAQAIDRLHALAPV